MKRPSRAVAPREHDSAVDRTLMAEERTFSAWVRTGLTSIATGVGIVKLLPRDQFSWVIEALGAVLVVVGAIAFVFGFLGYRRGVRHWRAAHRRAVPLGLLVIFAVLLIVAAGLALVAILPG